MVGGLHTLRKDPRLINELPQIINILLGDMNIIGPRPLVDKNFELYPIHVKATINHVKPGLTGIGSIVFRDEERLLSFTVFILLRTRENWSFGTRNTFPFILILCLSS